MGKPESTDLTTKEGRINFARQQWPIGIFDALDSMPPGSAAAKHAAIILDGMGAFRVKLYQIVQGHQKYLKEKNNAKEEQPVHRFYKGQ